MFDGRAAHAGGIKADLLEQRDRDWLRCRIELGAQDALAHAELVQCLRTLVPAQIAAHDQAVGILATWVVLQHAPRLFEACRIVCCAVGVGGEDRE